HFLFLCFLYYFFFFFFFFQAEDGIRDGHVTGVQTCALPISFGEIRTAGRDEVAALRDGSRRKRLDRRSDGSANRAPDRGIQQARSEERRVGKECRSRWSPNH